MSEPYPSTGVTADPDTAATDTADPDTADPDAVVTDSVGADGTAGADGAGGTAGARHPASLKRRFGALVVDWVLCVLIAGFFGPPVGSVWPTVVLIVEYAFFVGLFGQTPGMRLAGIRCVPVGGTGVLGVPRAALRGLLLALVVPGLIMDTGQRGLHDRAVGSVMLRA